LIDQDPDLEQDLTKKGLDPAKKVWIRKKWKFFASVGIFLAEKFGQELATLHT
jgi:hypothetical protein